MRPRSGRGGARLLRALLGRPATHQSSAFGPTCQVWTWPAAGSLTIEKVRAKNLSWQDVFLEIPVQIHNSPLAAALMAEIEPSTMTNQLDFDRCGSTLPAVCAWRRARAVCLAREAGGMLAARCLATRPDGAALARRLNLSVAPVLEKNLDFLNECLDDLMGEQNKLSAYQNQLRRQQQSVMQWKLARRQENQARRAAGEPGCRWTGCQRDTPCGRHSLPSGAW